MICVTVLYGQPTDEDEFDRYYRAVHTPIALKMPHLMGYTADRPKALNPAEKSPYYLIACLYFETMVNFQAALQSPEGVATVADVPNFASGGVTMLVDDQEIVKPF